MSYFIAEFIVVIIMHKPPKYRMLFKWGTYIDLLTILPRLIRVIFGISDTKKWGFFRILRIFKVFRIVRLIKYLQKLNLKKDEFEINYNQAMISPLTKQILILIVSLFSTLFIGAGLIIFIDDEWDHAFTFDLTYVDAIYYMAVTGSTLGYGDIVPTIPISRFAVVCLIIVIIYIFGVQISTIVAMMQGWDSYDQQFNLSNHDVVFLFDDNLEVLTSFLLYYFRFEKHTDIDLLGRKRRILIISNREFGVDNEVKAFLKLNMFEGRIKYIPSKGNVDRRLIDRGRLLGARSIYFLCNPASDHSSNQDKLCIIYSHFLKNHGVSADIYIQTAVEHSDFRNWEELDKKNRRFSVRTSTTESFISLAATTVNSLNISNVIEIVCTQKLVMQAMARNVFHQGFIQFLSSMLIDELESSNSETFSAYVVNFPKNCLDIQFDE